MMTSHTTHRLSTFVLLCVTLTTLSACGQKMNRIFGKRDTISPASLVGDWKAQAGTTVHISESPGRTLTMRGTDADGSDTVFTGTLLNINGTQIIEVPLTDPDRLTSNEVPVYHYGRLRLSGDTLTHQPLRPEWLEQMANQTDASRAPVEGSDRWVTVGDPEVMRDLLGKAVQDESAWGIAESFTRVK